MTRAFEIFAWYMAIRSGDTAPRDGWGVSARAASEVGAGKGECADAGSLHSVQTCGRAGVPAGGWEWARRSACSIGFRPPRRVRSIARSIAVLTGTRT